MPDGLLLTASEAGFALWDGNEKKVAGTFDAIARVEAWQRDMATYDHVYVEITLADGTAVRIDEHFRGFRILMDRLEQLPGFDADWWEKVILPPFASNALVAYVRGEATGVAESS